MTSLPDADHAVTRNGANCSKSDSLLPVCVDSVKRGKIKRNGKTALEKTAKERGRIPYRKMKTVVGRMEEDVMATNAELLLDLQDLEDLQSILVQHASGNTMNSSFSYQDITAIHDGTTGSQDQGAASRPKFSQGEMQLVENQPQPFELLHSWMEEENPRPANVSFLANGQTSRQFLSFNQPMVTQQTESSKFVTASIPQNSQIARNSLVAQPISIPAVPDICHDNANGVELGIGASPVGMFPLPSREHLKETGQMALKTHSIASQFAYTPEKPVANSQSSGKLFGILSLILQALNNPHIEEFEECYTNALQKALTEIQAAKGLLSK